MPNQGTLTAFRAKHQMLHLTKSPTVHKSWLRGRFNYFIQLISVLRRRMCFFSCHTHNPPDSRWTRDAGDCWVPPSLDGPEIQPRLPCIGGGAVAPRSGGPAVFPIPNRPLGDGWLGGNRDQVAERCSPQNIWGAIFLPGRHMDLTCGSIWKRHHAGATVTCVIRLDTDWTVTGRLTRGDSSAGCGEELEFKRDCPYRSKAREHPTLLNPPK